MQEGNGYKSTPNLFPTVLHTRYYAEMVNGNEVKRRRLALELTLQQAADKAGFSGRQQWAGIERGERKNLRADTLVKVAGVLGCSIEDLLSKPAPRKGKARKG